MLKIIAPSKALVKFFFMLNLSMSKPQREHALNTMETLIMCESRKTISNLNRTICDSTDQSAMSDFFTYSPWENDTVRRQTIKSLIRWSVEQNQLQMFQPTVIISIDDSLARKPKESKHFDTVDWHHDAHGQKQLAHGLSFMTCHIQIGDVSIPINYRIYLKAETIRKLNRKYRNKQKIKFATKIELAKEMLEEIAEHLPQEFKIYVLFDSWYAAKKLIKYCRANGWHVICALKSNRKFNGKKLARIARHIRHRRFTKTIVNSADSVSIYWVYEKIGRINGLDEEVKVFISKRHRSDKFGEFFLCTDTEMSARQALSFYTKRWAIEVDYLYLKTRLGLEDFRLRSYKGIVKFMQLVFLTLQYLHWRIHEEHSPPVKKLTDVIALHRTQQWQNTLFSFAHQVLKHRSIKIPVDNFLAKAA
ncbi:MAG: transposase [bacterium]